MYRCRMSVTPIPNPESSDGLLPVTLVTSMSRSVTYRDCHIICTVLGTFYHEQWQLGEWASEWLSELRRPRNQKCAPKELLDLKEWWVGGWLNGSFIIYCGNRIVIKCVQEDSGALVQYVLLYQIN